MPEWGGECQVSTAGTMKVLNLQFEDHEIPFSFGYDCQDSIVRELMKLDADRFILVSDRTVESLYVWSFESKLRDAVPVLTLTSEAGEGSKTLFTLADHCERAIGWGATRKSVVVTIGGGVPGNIGGLLAALLFRGIRLIHIPTSVIAALDSVISLKQAVNSIHGKNLFGTYYKPSGVYVDIETFDTLPVRDRVSGTIELIKNALAVRPIGIDFLRLHLNTNAEYDANTWETLLLEAVTTKLELMRTDHQEKKCAIVFEYGHTIGHAIELASSRLGHGTISHGEAVGLGMLLAAKVAVRTVGLSEKAVELHCELLRKAGAALWIPSEIKTAEIRQIVGFDNKRGYSRANAGIVPMILLEEIGRPAGPQECPLSPVPWSTIEETIEQLRD